MREGSEMEKGEAKCGLALLEDRMGLQYLPL